MNHAEVGQSILRLLPVGGLMAVVFGLMLDVNRDAIGRVNGNIEACQDEVNPNIVLSREQLAVFLTVSERDSKARVQEILQVPYCNLATLEVRAGVAAERAVYPLAFDPKTWLIVLYENDEYAGYQFRILDR
ncbi:MAG: hypothetical protein HC769_05200 [Cyanobacteria bacterium CRU_2_1]|nr:hypothetical protein [Cyanobacteria bacterium RU_5_0]NJR58296.1 hypothetical protein [Cyanobacteria bacterium CRU_2_1]